MVHDADVVVIGSGGLGAATAYFLMQLAAAVVVLVDRHALARRPHHAPPATPRCFARRTS
jgi:4-methylaminobutanoate oxidase (formaldehyde-forming)